MIENSPRDTRDGVIYQIIITERERFNFERFEVEEGGKYPTRADRLITILNAIKHVKHGVALRTRNRNRVICSNLWEELFANSHRVSQ